MLFNVGKSIVSKYVVLYTGDKGLCDRKILQLVVD